jgi:hypothetical protein
MMKTVPVEDAVGMVLCHDITQISPGHLKGRAYRKGHVIQLDDIPALLSLGKENIYVFDVEDGLVHEDEAAQRIADAVTGPGLRLTEPSEGRVNMLAERKGLLKINVEALNRINEIENIVIATLHTNQMVTAGLAVAGTRIIPLVIDNESIRLVEDLCSQFYPVIEIKPLRSLKVGIVTTGSEIYRGRIQDKFGPLLREKFADLDCLVLRQVFVSDSTPMTVRAIQDLLREGAQMVAVTGGMSVDPDDQTPASIRAAGARVITYGAPVFPGAMFMLAYMGDVPVVGLPGCVMYYRASIFDLVIPRVLAGEELTRNDIIALGHGGFCASCPECRYPNCAFGKGH